MEPDNPQKEVPLVGQEDREESGKNQERVKELRGTFDCHGSKNNNPVCFGSFCRFDY